MSDVLRRVAMMMAKVPPRIYSTWNPADAGSHGLSGGNLTASFGGSSVVGNTQYKTSGKWYWELSLLGAGYWFVGVSNSSQNRATYLGSPNSTGQQSNVVSWQGSGAGPVGLSLAAGDIIGLALDFTGGTLTVYKNNVTSVTLTTLSTGALTPSFSGYTTSEAVTANFGASAFTYSPPSGFNPGWYT
jgi:SPRY domain